MSTTVHNPSCSIAVANTVALNPQEMEKMARRRFQKPTPRLHRDWWTIVIRQDVFEDGQHYRRQKRIRLLPKSKSYRQAQQEAERYLIPMNQGLQPIGASVVFETFVKQIYIRTELPTMASTTSDRYEGICHNHLIPRFGKLCLRDLTPLVLQQFFSGAERDPVLSKLSRESLDKIRDVLSSVLQSAVKYDLLGKNPIEHVSLPPDRRGKKKHKPFIKPEEFELLLTRIAEPYATMISVALYAGLRVSELVGLRWEDIHADSISVDERYCRGDWSEPKSEASNATIPVPRAIIERIYRLKNLTVDVRAGLAVRKYRVVKSDGPNDLVFQSVKNGRPMRDNNILCRHIKPAARDLKMPWVNWLVLRRSFGTWMVKYLKADVKDAQAQMRHSRASTTLDFYAQHVPESQRRVADRLGMITEYIQ